MSADFLLHHYNPVFVPIASLKQRSLSRGRGLTKGLRRSYQGAILDRSPDVELEVDDLGREAQAVFSGCESPQAQEAGLGRCTQALLM